MLPLIVFLILQGGCFHFGLHRTILDHLWRIRRRHLSTKIESQGRQEVEGLVQDVVFGQSSLLLVIVVIVGIVIVVVAICKVETPDAA